MRRARPGPRPLPDAPATPGRPTEREVRGGRAGPGGQDPADGSRPAAEVRARGRSAAGGAAGAARGPGRRLAVLARQLAPPAEDPRGAPEAFLRAANRGAARPGWTVHAHRRGLRPLPPASSRPRSARGGRSGQDLAQVGGDRSPGIVVRGVAEGDLFEAHAVAMVGAADVQVTVDHGVRVEAPMPGFPAAVGAPYRYTGGDAHDWGAACWRCAGC